MKNFILKWVHASAQNIMTDVLEMCVMFFEEYNICMFVKTLIVEVLSCLYVQLKLYEKYVFVYVYVNVLLRFLWSEFRQYSQNDDI